MTKMTMPIPTTATSPYRAPKTPSKYKLSFSKSTADSPITDSDLQSSTRRRKYMRRGSKAPSMLLCTSLAVLADSPALYRAPEEEETEQVVYHGGFKQNTRGSEMNLLSTELQRVMITPPKTSPIIARPKKLSLERKRSVPSKE